MKVQFNKNDRVLEIFFPERVDSLNAENIKKNVNEEISQYSPEHIVMNMSETSYISSAGLRVILNTKKLVNDVKIVEVDTSLYEIFDMTGISQMIPIEKKMKQYSVENLKFIGRGATASVYRIDADTIIKVFNKEFAIDSIKREINISKAAFVSGIATAIPYEIVKVGDCYGTIYELIEASTLSSVIHSDNRNLEHYAVLYAKFMKEMNQVILDKNKFPSAKTRYMGYTKMLSPLLDPETSEIFCKIIEAIPDGNTFTHGDFHPNNIMVKNGDLLLIDMGEASTGSPLIDLMSFGCLRILADAVPDEVAVGVVGMSCDEIKKVWDILISTYFEGASAQDLRKINGTCLLYSSARALMIVLKVSQFTKPFTEFVVKKMKQLYNEESLESDLI